MGKAISVINWAVDSGDPAATLVALQAPAANLRSVTEECAADYTMSLAEAKGKKEGEEGEGWTEHRTREGHAFYYNWKSEQSQWDKPVDLPQQSSQLRREEIQVKYVFNCVYICEPQVHWQNFQTYFFYFCGIILKQPTGFTTAHGDS